MQIACHETRKDEAASRHGNSQNFDSADDRRKRTLDLAYLHDIRILKCLIITFTLDTEYKQA